MAGGGGDRLKEPFFREPVRCILIQDPAPSREQGCAAPGSDRLNVSSCTDGHSSRGCDRSAEKADAPVPVEQGGMPKDRHRDPTHEVSS